MRLFYLGLLACLLAPFAVTAQTRTMYLADGSGNLLNDYLRGGRPVYVTPLGTDSLLVSPDSTDNQYASIYKQNTGETFFRRVRAWSYPEMNDIYLFKGEILVLQFDGSYLFFRANQDKATKMLNDPDKGRVLAWKDSLNAIVIATYKSQRGEQLQAKATDDKRIVTAFARTLKSVRTDAAMVRDVQKWAGNPTTSVYLVENFTYGRNNYGTVLNKTAAVIIKYQWKGKCYLKWELFGYEALGGGTFSTDMTVYNANTTIQAKGAGSWVNMSPGYSYEIDCQ